MRSENNQSNWRLAAHIKHSQCIIKSLSLASAGVRTLGQQVVKNLLEHTLAKKLLQYSLLYPKLPLSTYQSSDHIRHPPEKQVRVPTGVAQHF